MAGESPCNVQALAATRFCGLVVDPDTNPMLFRPQRFGCEGDNKTIGLCMARLGVTGVAQLMLSV